ncbi:MAG: hypothetical protein JXA28_05540 [Bacteroidetes bacterium]|nr:hypothetical protein [Bacteroidota bacterium]
MKRLCTSLFCAHNQLGLLPGVPGTPELLAQTAAEHAVLFSTFRRIDTGLQKKIANCGARIAVRYEQLMIVRLPPGRSDELLTDIPGAVLLRSRKDCDALEENIPSRIRNVLRRLLPDENERSTGRDDSSSQRRWVSQSWMRVTSGSVSEPPTVNSLPTSAIPSLSLRTEPFFPGPTTVRYVLPNIPLPPWSAR